MRTVMLVVFSVVCALVPWKGASNADPLATASDKPAAKHESPFACDRLALTPEVRHRHFDISGPKLVSLRTGVRELPDGYEFSFPSDQPTYDLLTQWVGEERLCCPFFEISIRLESEGGPLWMRVTGRPGTKDFIKGDGAKWIADPGRATK